MGPQQIASGGEGGNIYMWHVGATALSLLSSENFSHFGVCTGLACQTNGLLASTWANGSISLHKENLKKFDHQYFTC